MPSAPSRWESALGILLGIVLVEILFGGLPWVIAANTYLLVPYLLLLGAAFVRETGRIAAGTISGLRFTYAYIHGLRLWRDGDRLRLDFVGWNLRSASFCMPVGLANLEKRLRPMILGGPIANFVLAAIGLGIAIELQGTRNWILWALFNLFYAVTAFANKRFGVPSEVNELAYLRGDTEEGRKYLAWFVENAVGADEVDRERILVELGLEYIAARRRVWRHADEGDVRLALEALGEARLHAPDDESVRVELGCLEAFTASYDRWDVERAKRALPTEEAARAANMEGRWVLAALRVAMAERRWQVALALVPRLSSFVGTPEVENSEEFQRWIQVVGKWVARKANRGMTS